MARVVVVMSTYNGEKYIERQIKSIVNQKNIDTALYIRDDGSTDNTKAILNSLADSYSNIYLNIGENVGWRRSFLIALKEAPEAEYYAFADQDDVWHENKVYKCIDLIKDINLPALCHCNKLKVTPDLRERPRQQTKVPIPPNYKWALLNCYAQGASSVFNNALRDMLCGFSPTAVVGHDYWLGLFAYLFGEVRYCDERLLLHVIHGNNVSDSGNVLRNRVRLMRDACQAGYFPNPAQDLLLNFSDKLNDNVEEFLETINSYRDSRANLEALLHDDQFKPAQKMLVPFFRGQLIFKRY